jgi:hypothetical protein
MRGHVCHARGVVSVPAALRTGLTLCRGKAQVLRGLGQSTMSIRYRSLVRYQKTEEGPMLIRSTFISAVALAAALSIGFTPPVEALTMKECSAKYQAAKTAGTLGGQKWNDFRKTQCGTDAAAAPATTPPTAMPAGRPAAAPATSTRPGNAVFPTAVSPKYTNESAGKARMHTCLDQYNANKATNANGGLKWIQKGGGYYSECNKQLKG